MASWPINRSVRTDGRPVPTITVSVCLKGYVECLLGNCLNYAMRMVVSGIVSDKILSQGMVQKILYNLIKPYSKSVKSTFYHSARVRSTKRHKPTREARDERGAFFYIKKFYYV
jgi:hypothetical protein